MNALDRIIQEISKQSQAHAASLIHEAKQQADEILSKGRADRDQLQQQSEEADRREYLEIVKRSEDADRQSRRRALLKARNQAIDEVIAEAKAKIENLPDEEYFNFLFCLFEKNALPRNGVIRFGPVDYVRIPDSFLERCEQVFPDYALEMSGNIESMSHGFVIDYGNVLQNCLIEEIFVSEGQKLRDKVYAILTNEA
jgi:V/A-type H+-transporting ATPase subunit E